MFGVSSVSAVNIEVKLGMLPTGLPTGAAAEVTKELGWLADLTEGKKKFGAVVHCMCESP